MVTLSRRRLLQAGAATGAVALWPTAVLLDRGLRPQVNYLAGTTLESTVVRGSGPGYRQLRTGAPWRMQLRQDLAAAHRGREDRREALATVVQVSDLHITDVQNPMRFEYIDRINATAHRPQELLGVHGTAALVQRINTLPGGPATGRPIDAVMSTGDNTDNQSGNELEWLLTLLAGGTVRPDSGDAGAFEGVAASGLSEYWQPESTAHDRYKNLGFPLVPGLIEASTQAFVTPGLNVPWLLTMGNHDVVANGMLENRAYVEEWSGGERKIFSARGDLPVLLAMQLATVKAGDDVGALIWDIATAGTTRTVHADERRLPFTGTEYVRLLYDDRYAGAGPVGHGYSRDADAATLYYGHRLAPQVVAISLDSTNQAGGIDGSIGSTQWAWLARELERARDSYVLVFTHHPSEMMANLASDPRTPGEERHSGSELVDLLHRFPNVLAWINGHTHHNRITAHAARNPRQSFWEINSASHIDAPQQARVIEVARNRDGTVSLFTTMIDADSPLETGYDDLSLPGLASLYRELSYNDPAYRDRQGSSRDRNTELILADPL
ncbi:MAG TPA: TIGR03767 family metallophosphoesterase [Aeromicrobium sp.]|nr:TIGR03767 family metallophosphoesterase [Aeromicrobium sp.]